MEEIRDSWQEVKRETVVACWDKTGRWREAPPSMVLLLSRKVDQPEEIVRTTFEEVRAAIVERGEAPPPSSNLWSSLTDTITLLSPGRS